MSQKIEPYGLKWGNDVSQLDIELFFVRNGGIFKKSEKSYGLGLFHHTKAAMSLLWPDDIHHRWSDLLLKSYCENEILVVTGCANSGKTHTFCKIVLIDYWSSPNNTLWLMSTTEGRGAELRSFGCLKDNFNAARERFPELAGNPLDYLKCITTDSIEEGSARSLRKGIVIVPCKTGGTSSGLAPYIGIKSPRLRHFGDELAVMSDAFLNAYANWYGQENFKGMMCGNFMETDDPLGIACTPADGWGSWVDEGKTQTWRSQFYDAFVVALDGRDSPNFDFPAKEGERQKYPFLIGPKKLEGVSKTKGTDSWEWYSQCVGKPVKGMDIWRILSKEWCIRHKATDDAIWHSSKISLYALDPAYGLGDRCVGRRFEFGLNVDNQMIISSGEPEIIPIKININMDAEDQIAAYVIGRLDELHIPYSNCFYDSFGRGTLGFSFSRLCGRNCPVPVDSGSQPTDRPVRFDLLTEEYNPRTRALESRLTRCDEYYHKFVTEMWFSVREAIESEQVRGLDEETLREGCSRKFSRNKRNNKIEIETKDEYKTRMKGRSPDLMDCYAIGMEGARRLGFQIKRIEASNVKQTKKPDWISKASEEYSSLMKSRALQSY